MTFGKSKGLEFALDPLLKYRIFIHDPKYFIIASKPLPTPGIMQQIQEQEVIEGILLYDLYLSVTKQMKINQKNNPCNEELAYDFQACVQRSITKQVGCRPPWDMSNSVGSDDIPICNKLEKIKEIGKKYRHFAYCDLEVILEETKCLKPCFYNEYKLAMEPEIHDYDNDQYESGKFVQLFFPEKKTTIKKEVEFYSLISLVSDIGGALGLFLGFSFVMVWDEAEVIFKIVKNYFMGEKIRN